MSDTMHAYTDAEIEALPVPPQVLAGFLRTILMSRGDVTKTRGFYPSGIPTYIPEHE